MNNTIEMKKAGARKRSSALYKIIQCETLPPELKILACIIITNFKAGAQYRAGWVAYAELIRKSQRSRSRVASLLKLLAKLDIFRITKLTPEQRPTYCREQGYKLGIKTNKTFAITLYEANGHELWNGKPGELSAETNARFAEALGLKSRSSPKSNDRNRQKGKFIASRDKRTGPADRTGRSCGQDSCSVPDRSCGQDSSPVLPTGLEFTNASEADGPAVPSPSYATAPEVGFAHSVFTGSAFGDPAAAAAQPETELATPARPNSNQEGPPAALPGADDHQGGSEAAQPGDDKQKASPAPGQFNDFVGRYELIFGTTSPEDKAHLLRAWNDSDLQHRWVDVLDKFCINDFYAGRKPDSTFRMAAKAFANNWETMAADAAARANHRPIRQRVHQCATVDKTLSESVRCSKGIFRPHESERAMEIAIEIETKKAAEAAAVKEQAFARTTAKLDDPDWAVRHEGMDGMVWFGEAGLDALRELLERTTNDGDRCKLRRVLGLDHVEANVQVHHWEDSRRGIVDQMEFNNLLASLKR